MQVSVIVPSKGCAYLRYLFLGLKEQNVRPSEVILILKACKIKQIEKLCGAYGLPYVIIKQEKGYFTHALNMGKKEARGDILVFTDDDIIPPKKWLQRYLELHRAYPKIAGICSRDIYLDLTSMKILPTPDDKLTTRLYRWLVRPWLEQPHPLFTKYKLGVYLTKTLDIAYGPYIPYKTCYSLPFRGANMSFKNEYVYDVWFPEHPELKIAPGNEQYFGIQLALRNRDIIYTFSNPILHIAHQSLSRSQDEIHDSRIRCEMDILKKLVTELLKNSTLL